MDEFSEIKNQIPVNSPVQPAELNLDSEFQFDCHPGISCFNACCRSIDIVLTPYDIVRLKRHFDMDSRELVARHSVPYEMDVHGLPGLKLATKPGTEECVFLTEEGCSVYQDRPAACRYYALGSIGVRKKDEGRVEDIFFLVREDHCKGHGEPRTQAVRDYRQAQGVDAYDEMNREWRDIIIKKRSSGPTVGAPSQRSMQLFDMCSYDMDSFRDFIQSPGFRTIFDLSDQEVGELCDDEDRLLQFSFRFLKQVLFGEFTIPRKDGSREQRIAERRETWQGRKAAEVEKFRQQQERQRYGQDLQSGPGGGNGPGK